jgi:hypothetical protein
MSSSWLPLFCLLLVLTTLGKCDVLGVDSLLKQAPLTPSFVGSFPFCFFFFPFHLFFFLFFLSKKLEVIDPLFSPLALVSQVLENPWHRWISDIHHT